MKICADEHVSTAIVRVVQEICLSPDNELIHVENIEMRGKDDEVWVRVFADGGGQIVISADAKITRRHAELIAITDCGLTLLVLPSRFANAKCHLQAAYICHHWPAIEDAIRNTGGNRFWKLNWGYVQELMKPLDIDIQDARKKLRKAERRTGGSE